MGQWLRFHTPNAVALGSIPGQGTKILHTTWHGSKKNGSLLYPLLVCVHFLMGSYSLICAILQPDF